MFRKFTLFTLISFFLLNLCLVAQDDRDSTDEKWHNYKWSDWEDNYEWLGWDFHGKPFIEVNYGFSTPKHDKLIGKFSEVGLAEIKLGYATQDSYYSENIIEFHDKYSFVSKFSAELKSSSVTLGDMRSDLWRFGFAKRSGYGYKFKNLSILPYHGSGFVWSKLNMVDYPATIYLLTNPPMNLQEARDDTDILNRFHDAFRFGSISEGGVRVEVASFASIDFGYEATVIFPRHLVWKQIGSSIIEESAIGVLNHFIDEVGDSSPYAAPIVNFLLKNGLSYAFYTLRKTNMNWPFSTETPLTYETFKFGLTFTF